VKRRNPPPSWASDNTTIETFAFSDTHNLQHIPPNVTAMSTDNATRFYWAKLDNATAIFKAGNLEEAADICLQLCNEMRCPKSAFPVLPDTTCPLETRRY
jgi:hypothetical protein